MAATAEATATTRQTSGTTAPHGTRSVAVILRDIAKLADELAQVVEWTNDDDDLTEAVVAAPTIAAQVDAAIGHLLGTADRRLLAPRSGFRRLDQYLLAHTNASGPDIRSRLRRTQWLRDFDLFAEAHARGIMTNDHLEKIRKGLDNTRTHEQLRRDQQILIDAAATCGFADFERACDYWTISADPDGAEPRDQLDQTSFRARRRHDGMVKLDGLLDPLSGQAFLSAWEKQVQQLTRQDEAHNHHRSNAKQGADALLRLIARGAAREDGSQPDPLIHLVMSQSVAEDTLRRLSEPDLSPLPVDPDDVDSRCELIDGTPIHPHLMLSVLGLAALQRTVLTARGRPLSTSYPTRAFPKWLRHILMLRSRGRCEADSCDAPFPWLQADHDQPHSRGGPTTYTNANLYCRPHNLAKGAR